jgi:hypothetical protein
MPRPEPFVRGNWDRPDTHTRRRGHGSPGYVAMPFTRHPARQEQRYQKMIEEATGGNVLASAEGAAASGAIDLWRPSIIAMPGQ